MTVLLAEGLTRRFGGLTAVADVSLALAVGELHAVIGPNGAGKSTLVNLLAGELRPNGGRILLRGDQVTAWPAWRRARHGIGRSFQRNNLLRGMTVFENARLAAQAGVFAPRRWLRPAAQDAAPIAGAWRLLERVGLIDRATAVADTLSHGELRLLEIALALANDPPVLLLDEPLAGMGVEEGGRVAALLRDLARDHAVLLIEHDMDVVFAVADRLTVMVDGRVLERGPPAAIRASAAVRDAYLGQGRGLTA
jgi:branched-chain amino acid transport system ATP-binding protein